MKATKTMLLCVATFLLTWLIIGSIAYMLNDYSFKATMTHGAMCMVLITIGWVPALLVGLEYNDIK